MESFDSEVGLSDMLLMRTYNLAGPYVYNACLVASHTLQHITLFNMCGFHKNFDEEIWCHTYGKTWQEIESITCGVQV